MEAGDGRSGPGGMSVISFLLMRRRAAPPDRLPPTASSEEQQVALMVSRLLRGGVLLSAAIVLIGAIVYLNQHPEQVPFYHVFTGEPHQLRTLHGIVYSALSFSGRGIIQLGLLVLLATPLARVAVALVGFMMAYDKLYTAVAGLVLAILVFGFLALPP